MFETLPVVFDHQHGMAVAARRGSDPVGRARIGVGEHVAEQGVDEGTEILGIDAYRKAAAGSMYINRPLLLVGEHLPEGCSLPHDRAEV